MSDGTGNQPIESGTLKVVKGSWAVRCPHCEHDLDSVNADLLMSPGPGIFAFGKRYIYSCPSCNKVLGVSHRKGFWMG